MGQMLLLYDERGKEANGGAAGGDGEDPAGLHVLQDGRGVTFQLNRHHEPAASHFPDKRMLHGTQSIDKVLANLRDVSIETRFNHNLQSGNPGGTDQRVAPKGAAMASRWNVLRDFGRHDRDAYG